jgi:hypothetical protein
VRCNRKRASILRRRLDDEAEPIAAQEASAFRELGIAVFDWPTPPHSARRVGASHSGTLLRSLDPGFMPLRHTAVVREAEAGATDDEIAAITGHSLKTVDQILAHYLVRTAPQAATFQKRMACENATGSTL